MGNVTCFRRDQVASSEVLDKYGKWTEPRDDVAESATKCFSAHHETSSVLGTRTIELGEFGEGHTLYFFFLKWFSCLFFVLFVITGLPSILFNMEGGFYQEITPEALSMGNVGGFFSTNMSKLVANATFGLSGVQAEEAIVSVFHGTEALTNSSHLHVAGISSVRKEDTHIFMSIMDLTGAVLYFMFTLVAIHTQHQVAQEVNLRTVTIADYSVYITRLPGDTLAVELKDFLMEFGDVLMVELVRSDCELIGCAKTKKYVYDQLELCKAVVQKKATKTPKGYVPIVQMEYIPKWEFKAEKCESYTEHLISTRRAATVVCAFVTFREEQAKLALLDKYPNSFGRRVFMSRSKRFRGKYRIKVRPATEPTDIYWENLHITTMDRLKRKAVTTTVKYLALLFGFVLMNLATAMHNAASTSDQIVCDSSCEYFDADGNLSLDDNLKEEYKNCWNADSEKCGPEKTACYGCYCEKIILNLSSGIKSRDNDYCRKYFQAFALKTGSQVIAVSGVVMINLALTVLAMKLSKFERHNSRVSEERSLAHKLFLSQFINTVVSFLVATTYVPRLKWLVKNTPLAGLLFEGKYIDTTPTWYAEVGRSLTLTMVAQCVVRLLRVAAKYVAFKWKFWWRLNSLTQSQLNDCHIGPDFHLAPRYGELMNLIFVTMFFGSGIPVLYFVTCISLFLQYWAEKIELLKLSKRPSAYGDNLAKMVGSLLPYAAIWHLAFSLWSFSFYKTARSPLVSEESTHHIEWFLDLFYWLINADGSKIDSATHSSRILQQNSAHHLVGFILVAVVIIGKITMSTWITVLQQLAALVGISKGTGDFSFETAGYPAFTAAVRSKALVGPTSYAIKFNPQYMNTLNPNEGLDARNKAPDNANSRSSARKQAWAAA